MNSGDKIVLIDNEHDLDKILKTNDRVIALVYASWCPFCRKFLPVFQQYAQEEQHYFLCVQDDQESIGDKYSIDIFPTVLFFEKGSLFQTPGRKTGCGIKRKTIGGVCTQDIIVFLIYFLSSFFKNRNAAFTRNAGLAQTASGITPDVS